MQSVQSATHRRCAHAPRAAAQLPQHTARRPAPQQQPRPQPPRRGPHAAAATTTAARLAPPPFPAVARAPPLRPRAPRRLRAAAPRASAERKEYYDFKDMPPLPLGVSKIYVPDLDHVIYDKACEESRLASLAIFYDIYGDDQYARRLTRRSAITALCMYDRDDVSAAEVGGGGRRCAGSGAGRRGQRGAGRGARPAAPPRRRGRRRPRARRRRRSPCCAAARLP